MTRTGHITRATVTALAALLSAACAGQISASDPPDAAPGPGDEADAGPGSDAAPPGPSYNVTGATRDYVSGDPVPNVALAAEGMTPEMQTQSGIDGSYTLADVPASTSFYFRAMPDAMAAAYIPTVNPAITVLDQDVQTDVRLVTLIYAQRQHTSVGIARDPVKSLVVAELRNLDGTPFEGVPLDAITLLDSATMTPILVDKYFIGASGDVDPALLASTAYPAPGGMGMASARVAFLNVPSGSYGIAVSFTPEGAMTPTTAAGMATTYDGGATLTRVIHDPASGGGTPSFTTDIYPIFMKASQGGQDCASCHTLGGSAGNVLILDDGAPNVHARLTASLLLVDVANPPASLILSKPLFETPPNHPNAVWLDMTDPNYVKIMAWIAGGAPL